MDKENIELQIKKLREIAGGLNKLTSINTEKNPDLNWYSLMLKMQAQELGHICHALQLEVLE